MGSQCMPAPRPTRLLLVGAGHTHLHLIKNGQKLHYAGYAVTLLAPSQFRYSGVASSSATGALPSDIGVVDVAALTGSAIAHHAGQLVDLDGVGSAGGERAATKNRALTDDGTWLDFDVLSVNVGSVAARHDIEATDEVWANDVLSVKPLEQLRDLNARIASAATCGGSPVRVTLIGGGPTATELAGNLLRGDGVEGSPALQVTVIEASESFMSYLPTRAQRRLLALLRRRGVRLMTGHSVRRIDSDRVVLDGRAVVEHDVVVLATGLVSPVLLGAVGLSDHESAADGIPVRATLQHRDHDDIYAVGDCAHFMAQPLAKIGVYGVRQGPVLLESLLARAAREPLPEFTPQRHALQVLDLGGGMGLATRGPWWWMGRAALRLKRRVDRRWLAQYQ